jgi:hypothetical protein
VKFNFTTESFVEEVGDLISIDVILFKDFEENPFKKDYREFAIDFTYPIKLEYTYILSIPEGYTFDELPKPTRVSNADKSISFFNEYQCRWTKSNHQRSVRDQEIDVHLRSIRRSENFLRLFCQPAKPTHPAQRNLNEISVLSCDCSISNWLLRYIRPKQT